MIDGRCHGTDYHKMRIIQLFEGDFNEGLKYLLGRQLMRHIVKKRFITPARNVWEHSRTDSSRSHRGPTASV